MTNTELQDPNATLEFLAYFPDEFPGKFPEEFNSRFVRCLRLLRFIAGRVLGDGEGVDEAVRNCFVSASRGVKSFESEVAFRAWLVRVQIDEALLLLCARNAESCRGPDWHACMRVCGDSFPSKKPAWVRSGAVGRGLRLRIPALRANAALRMTP